MSFVENMISTQSPLKRKRSLSEPLPVLYHCNDRSKIAIIRPEIIATIKRPKIRRRSTAVAARTNSKGSEIFGSSATKHPLQRSPYFHHYQTELQTLLCHNPVSQYSPQAAFCENISGDASVPATISRDSLSPLVIVKRENSACRTRTLVESPKKFNHHISTKTVPAPRLLNRIKLENSFSEVTSNTDICTTNVSQSISIQTNRVPLERNREQLIFLAISLSSILLIIITYLAVFPLFSIPITFNSKTASNYYSVDSGVKFDISHQNSAREHDKFTQSDSSETKGSLQLNILELSSSAMNIPPSLSSEGCKDDCLLFVDASAYHLSASTEHKFIADDDIGNEAADITEKEGTNDDKHEWRTVHSTLYDDVINSDIQENYSQMEDKVSMDLEESSTVINHRKGTVPALSQAPKINISISATVTIPISFNDIENSPIDISISRLSVEDDQNSISLYAETKDDTLSELKDSIADDIPKLIDTISKNLDPMNSVITDIQHPPGRHVAMGVVSTLPPFLTPTLHNHISSDNYGIDRVNVGSNVEDIVAMSSSKVSLGETKDISNLNCLDSKLVLTKHGKCTQRISKDDDSYGLDYAVWPRGGRVAPPGDFMVSQGITVLTSSPHVLSHGVGRLKKLQYQLHLSSGEAHEGVLINHEISYSSQAQKKSRVGSDQNCYSFGGSVGNLTVVMYAPVQVRAVQLIYYDNLEITKQSHSSHSASLLTTPGIFASVLRPAVRSAADMIQDSENDEDSRPIVESIQSSAPHHIQLIGWNLDPSSNNNAVGNDLGTFEYVRPTGQENEIQTFLLPVQGSHSALKAVTVSVLSNHGKGHTRVCRIRVYGSLADVDATSA